MKQVIYTPICRVKLQQEATIRKLRIVQKEGNREVNWEIRLSERRFYQ